MNSILFFGVIGKKLLMKLFDGLSLAIQQRLYPFFPARGLPNLSVLCPCPGGENQGTNERCLDFCIGFVSFV